MGGVSITNESGVTYHYALPVYSYEEYTYTRKIDTQGVPASVDMIAATKTTIPFLVKKVIDRCMQIHGAGGLTEDYMMAEAYNYARWCRQADGPDQVHQMALGKQIIDRFSG